ASTLTQTRTAFMRPHQISVPAGRLPPGAIGHNRGAVRPNYAFMPPEGVPASRPPHSELTIAPIPAAPGPGARFAQFVLEIEPGGGSRQPIREEGVQHFYYVLSGVAEIALDGQVPQPLTAGGFAYIPPATAFALRNQGPEKLRILGLRKRYEAI